MAKRGRPRKAGRPRKTTRRARVVKSANPAMPRGRPPVDPEKRAAWESARAAAQGLNVQTVLLSSGYPVDNPNETPKQILSRIQRMFRMIDEYLDGIIDGTTRSLVITGAPGIGKTYRIMQKLDEAQKRDSNLQVEVIAGVITPINLYKRLYQNKDDNCITILDDADQIFNDENGVSILKAALDLHARRNISWMSESSALANEDVPKRFEYEGRMIFISNINFGYYIDTARTKITPHLRAIMDRAIYIDTKLHSTREKMAWVTHLIQDEHIFKPQGATAEIEKKMVTFLEKHREHLRDISLRTAIKLLHTIISKPNNWTEMAELTLIK